jgi:hypothetical protein
MARSICPACDRPFVKGRIVMFMARTGPRRCRVCTRCADAGTTIVADKSGDLSRCVYCENNAAVCCLACAMKMKTAEAK